MDNLVWDSKYSVGIVEIDQQHRQMFELINKLISTLENSPTTEYLTQTINQLVTYKKVHFKTEEKYFEQYSFPDAVEHIKAHTQFNESLELLEKKLGTDSIELGYELVDFLEDWLVDHIMDLDQKYAKYFRDHNLIV